MPKINHYLSYSVLPKVNEYLNFVFAPYFVEIDSKAFGYSFDKRALQTWITCTNDCSFTSLKQFFNATQQNSVKPIYLSCKINFGFK